MSFETKNGASRHKYSIDARVLSDPLSEVHIWRNVAVVEFQEDKVDDDESDNRRQDAD